MANVNTTTVVPSTMPGLEGLVSPLYQGALDAYNLPFASYSGQLVAPFTTDQRSAFDRIAGTVNDPRYQSAFNTGIGMATGAGTPSAAYNSAIAGLGSPVNYQSVTSPTVTAGTVNPGNIGTGQFGAQALGQYMSPYLQSVVDTTTGELDRQAGKNQAALRAQLAAKGSFGDRSTLALTEQQRNADQVRANTVAQLMQGGYGQAASLFNTDQARALEAAKSNQSAGLQGGIANLNADLTANLNNAGNFLAAQRANQSTDLTAQQLYRQGLGQVAGFDVSNRGLGTQAAQVLGALGANAQNTNLAGLQALLGSGSLQQQQQQAQDTAAYNQFLRQVGYPQQQVGNLAGILYGAPKGQTTTTPAPSDLQTAAGLGTSLLGILGGTGGFGSNGWLTSLFKADGGRVGYADGGEIDDEDDVSAFGPLDDDEDEAAGDDGDPQAGAGSVAAGLNAFGEPSGDGGGDGMAPAEGGDGAAPGGSMTGRVRMSGIGTPEMMKAALANAMPQPIGAQSFFAGGIDNPLTALGLGILSSKSPHLGEALGQGGLAALTRISAQKKEAMAQEALRQKGALAQAQLIQKALDGDNKAFNEALKIEEQEKGKDARTKLEQQMKFAIAERQNASREKVGAGNNAATRYAADTSAAARLQAAIEGGKLRNAAPTQIAKWVQERDALPEGDPNRAIFDKAITHATRTNTTLMDNAVAAGHTPGTPEYQKFIDEAVKKPQVSIDQKAESEGEKALQKGAADRFNTAEAAADKIPHKKALLDLAETVLPYAQQGKGADVITDLKSLAKSAGVNLGALGLSDNVSATELLNTLNAELVKDTRAPGEGAVSDYERKLFTRAAIGSGNTVGGNRLMVDVGRKMLEREEHANDIRREVFAQQGTSALDKERQYKARLKELQKTPLFDQNTIDQLIGIGNAKPATKKETAAVSVGNLPKVERNAKGIELFNSLPPGAVFLDHNGVPKVKPPELPKK